MSNKVSERSILRIEREQVAAFNRHDIKSMLGHFASGFVGFSSTRHERISGRAALGKTFRHYLGVSPKVRYAVSQPKVQMIGDAAVVSFYWRVQLAPGHRIEGRGSHVFAKIRGRWRIVHEHFSRSH
jgi:ketosteroid isomerase-like protein